MTRFRNILALLRGQLWIVPALITAIAAVLAYFLLRYGTDLLAAGGNTWWLYNGDASTARDLLASLLSGLMTMTSLIVSVTFVILTLAANQLGPRLISTFMADRQIQSVLGLFLGTILYVIIVIRTLDDKLGSDGVPHVAVTAASILTIACLFALLFYIHKIARSIIADNVVDAVARNLRHDLRDILANEDARDAAAPAVHGRTIETVALKRCGYIQVIDYNALIGIASRAQAALEVKVRAGHYVLENGDYVAVLADQAPNAAFADAVRDAFVIGAERTPAQDLEHGIRQLVEIALRALSPGINDPFTAVAVIDRLAGAFEEIFSHPLQPRVLRDGAGDVRLVVDRSDARGLVDAAFDPIRQAGAVHPAILIRLADALAQLAPVLTTPETHQAVLAQLDKLADTVRHSDLAPLDRHDSLGRVELARGAVGPGPATDGA